MEIGRIQGATRVLGKSQGYYGLPIRDEAKNLGDLPHMLLTLEDSPITGPNTPTMQTVWHPNADEIERLASGAPIYVSLVGIGHPPISVVIGETPDPSIYQTELAKALARIEELEGEVASAWEAYRESGS